MAIMRRLNSMSACLSVFRVTVLALLPLGGAVAQPAAPLNNGAMKSQSAAVGVTQALRDVKLSMTVAGRIDGVFVREGSRVRQGQLLMHLDRTLEELEVQRRRLLVEDNARLQELQQKEKILIEQVNALQPLLANGGVSRKQGEDEVMALGSVSAERKAIEAMKVREGVELALAQEAFERRHLRSPIDGVITKVALRVGESVGPHEAVITVVDISRVRFIGTVPARAGLSLKPGSTVKIELGQDTQSKTRSAKVVFVSPITDPSSGLIELIAEFDNADGSIRPGISGRLLF